MGTYLWSHDGGKARYMCNAPIGLLRSHSLTSQHASYKMIAQDHFKGSQQLFPSYSAVLKAQTAKWDPEPLGPLQLLPSVGAPQFS